MNSFFKRSFLWLLIGVLACISGCVLGSQNITASLGLQNPECDLETGSFDTEDFNSSYPETWKAVNTVVLELGETVKLKNDETRTVTTEVSLLSRLANISKEMNQMEYTMHIRIHESLESQRYCTVVLTIALLDKQGLYLEDLVESQPEKSQLKRNKEAKEAIT